MHQGHYWDRSHFKLWRHRNTAPLSKYISSLSTFPFYVDRRNAIIHNCPWLITLTKYTHVGLPLRWKTDWEEARLFVKSQKLCDRGLWSVRAVTTVKRVMIMSNYTVDLGKKSRNRICTGFTWSREGPTTVAGPLHSLLSSCTNMFDQISVSAATTTSPAL